MVICISALQCVLMHLHAAHRQGIWLSTITTNDTVQISVVAEGVLKVRTPSFLHPAVLMHIAQTVECLVLTGHLITVLKTQVLRADRRLSSKTSNTDLFCGRQKKKATKTGNYGIYPWLQLNRNVFTERQRLQTCQGELEIHIYLSKPCILLITRGKRGKRQFLNWKKNTVQWIRFSFPICITHTSYYHIAYHEHTYNLF